MKHGGSRDGAGRPKGSGAKYRNEKSKAMRVPATAEPDIKKALELRERDKKQGFPLGEIKYQQNESNLKRPTNFDIQSPKFQVAATIGKTHVEDKDDDGNVLDLGNYLIQNPDHTWTLEVSGDSMKGAGINSGDLLIVERSAECLEPKQNTIVVAELEGDMTVKRFYKDGEKIFLIPEPESEEHKKTEVKDEKFKIVGIVKKVIHSF